MSLLVLTYVEGAVRLRVRLQPRASRDRIVGLHGTALKAQVTAPPVEGAANAALEQLVAQAVGVGRSSVRVISGITSREKVVEVATLDSVAIARRLERLATDKPPSPSELR
ncbi:MAG TPA: DUF167 family protein [Candidatus Binatia bacterium]|nr:DUF167 family protein [Candidatus Binatia bacterium]